MTKNNIYREHDACIVWYAIMMSNLYPFYNLCIEGVAPIEDNMRKTRLRWFAYVKRRCIKQCGHNPYIRRTVDYEPQLFVCYRFKPYIGVPARIGEIIKEKYPRA